MSPCEEPKKDDDDDAETEEDFLCAGAAGVCAAVLLVDEPFVGLDAAGKEALLELFDAVHEDGAALVVATHELAFVQRVQRCVALRDGQIVHDGPTEGIDVLSLVT